MTSSPSSAGFRQVAEGFWVAPQLSVHDVEAAAASGFRTILNNRPDGEEAGQPDSRALRAAAEARGLAWLDAPIAALTHERVQAVEDALAQAERPVLAFCRSGTRSITAWALAELLAGRRTRETLVECGAKAGYDLSRLPV